MEENKIIKIRINDTEYELQTTVENVAGLREELDLLAQKSQVQFIIWGADD